MTFSIVAVTVTEIIVEPVAWNQYHHGLLGLHGGPQRVVRSLWYRRRAFLWERLRYCQNQCQDRI